MATEDKVKKRFSMFRIVLRRKFEPLGELSQSAILRLPVRKFSSTLILEAINTAGHIRFSYLYYGAQASSAIYG
jgi:hypothetical protein